MSRRLCIVLSVHACIFLDSISSSGVNGALLGPELLSSSYSCGNNAERARAHVQSHACTPACHLQYLCHILIHERASELGITLIILHELTNYSYYFPLLI